jgi:ketosteroid isomerase-like protein
MADPKTPLAAIGTPDEIEARLYEALRQGDIDKLMSVWSDDDEIVCVHPGGPRLVGPTAIRAAFDSMFGHGAIDVHPEKVRRLQTHDSAVHSVLERIQVMTQQGPQSAWVIATNVYLKSTLGWRLVAHHASPGTQSELREVVDPPSVLH